jgi:hypothetical protein
VTGPPTICGRGIYSRRFAGPSQRGTSLLAAVFAAALVSGHLVCVGFSVLAALAGLQQRRCCAPCGPQLPGPGQLTAVYTLDSTGQELVWIGGPVLAALLATGSHQLPLLGCAAASAGEDVQMVDRPRNAVAWPQPEHGR